MMLQKITVFGSAVKAINDKYKKEAFELGEIIGRNGQTLVFGIGDNGMMGEVFRGALKHNAPIRGITTPKLLELQCENPALFKEGEIEVVSNLSIRKFKMFEEADAIFVLPGGWGTMDEFAEYSVLVQTGEIKKKPLIFINLNGFWDATREQIRRMYTEGAVNDDRVDYLGFVEHAQDAFAKAEEISDQLLKKL